LIGTEDVDFVVTASNSLLRDNSGSIDMWELRSTLQGMLILADSLAAWITPPGFERKD
jgi:hypothetical protein